MDFLNKLPKPVLIFSIILIGVIFIFYANRPHSICDSQSENFKNIQAGYLFATKSKGIKIYPAYPKALKDCREGMGSSGACLDLMQILKKLVLDLETMDSSCGEAIEQDLPVVRKAIAEGILTLVQIGWGESIPNKGEKKYNWLAPPEFALFCSLKDHWTRFYGNDGWERLKDNVLNQLPGKIIEARQDGAILCKNCSQPVNAVIALGGRQEVFERSLFSIKCERYR